MLGMRLVALQVELPSHSPVLLLQSLHEEERMLPIFIGPLEASSIAFALDGVTPDRPTTHDVFCQALEASGTSIARIEITDVVDGTFFAELHLATLSGEVVISSRPSDAIALALRTRAPIFVAEDVVESQSVHVSMIEEDEERTIERFQDFLEDVSPDDFR